MFIFHLFKKSLNYSEITCQWKICHCFCYLYECGLAQMLKKKEHKFVLWYKLDNAVTDIWIHQGFSVHILSNTKTTVSSRTKYVFLYLKKNIVYQNTRNGVTATKYQCHFGSFSFSFLPFCSLGSQFRFVKHCGVAGMVSYADSHELAWELNHCLFLWGSAFLLSSNCLKMDVCNGACLLADAWQC